MDTRQQQINGLRLVTLIIAAVLLASVLYLTTPQGQALAQELIHFFTQNSSDTLPAPTQNPLVWTNLTETVVPVPTSTAQPGPIFTTDCGDYSAPKCSIQQIRSKVSFNIKELSNLPQDIILIGATGGPDKIILVYGTQDYRYLLSIEEQPWSGNPEQANIKVGASADVQKVNIGNQVGEYVKGSWGYLDGDTQMHWDETADVQTIHWVDEGILYNLQVSTTRFDMAELILLAENLTTNPVAYKITLEPETPTPSYDPKDFHLDYPLTVAEAGKLAGFAVTEPSRLPSVLSLLGATYDNSQKLVSIYYQHSLDITQVTMTQWLLLKEELISSTGSVNLPAFIAGDHKEIYNYPPDTIVGKVEKVQIGNIQGQYVEGYWHSEYSGINRFWDSDFTRKKLRWQVNSIAYELSYWGTDISKEDLITIAKYIK